MTSFYIFFVFFIFFDVFTIDFDVNIVYNIYINNEIEREGLTMTIIKKEQLNKLISKDYTVNNRTEITFNKNSIIFRNSKIKEAITIKVNECFKIRTVKIFTETLIKELQKLGKLKIEADDKTYINGII